MTSRGMPVEERFWLHVAISDPEECWPWTASRLERGYGAFALTHTQQIRAHRFAYQISHGPIKEGDVVRHSCDNPPCCNPNHLLAGSQQENIEDKTSRNRQAKGEANAASKLTNEQVFAIQNDHRPQRRIAKDYGVCKSTIGYIKRRERWGHICQ